MNTAILALALVAVAFIRAPGAPEGSPARASARTIVEGIQFVRKTPVLLSAMVIDTGVMSVGFVRPLLPILALDVYMVGEKGLGVMGSATAIGAILATVALLRVGNVQRKGAAIVLAYAVYACGLLLLGLAPWFLLALVALALLGFMDVLAFTIKQSTEFQTTLKLRHDLQRIKSLRPSHTRPKVLYLEFNGTLNFRSPKLNVTPTSCLLIPSLSISSTLYVLDSTVVEC